MRRRGLSSHADQPHLLAWTQHISPPPKHTFVVHGQAEVTEFYAGLLRDHGLSAHAPDPGEVYDLLENRVAEPGTLRTPPAAGARITPAASPAFRRLEQTARALLEVVEHNRGGSNKDLAKFTDQLRALIEKWDR